MLTSQDVPLRAIDLFCGAGGLSKGFRDSGYEIKFALDSDPDSCATYALNHPGTHVECRPINSIEPSEVRRLAGGQVDIILGGPSCQSFSTAGRRSGWVADGDVRNDLWEHMFAMVDYLKPRAFLMENVPGMVYWRDGAFGRRILERFSEVGYQLSKQILLAADWGVPQRRRRLFMVGLREGGTFSFPKPTHMGGWRRDSLELWEGRRKRDGLLEHLTVWDAIGDLPPLTTDSNPARYALPPRKASHLAQHLRGGNRTLRDHEAPPLSEDVLSLVAHVPQGGTWRDVPPYLLPDRYRGMRRTDGTNLLGRLDPDLPSYTITTQFNNVTTGCFTHPDEERSLSVREGARLQTFPDTYRFVGSLNSRCRQIGNAVPPLLASVLAHEIADQVWGAAAGQLHPRPIIPQRTLRLKTQALHDEQASSRRLNAGTQDSAAMKSVMAVLDQQLSRVELVSREESGTRREDVALPDEEIVIFVNGCFLHGCPEHMRTTKSMSFWWAPRIQNQREIDDRTRDLWERDGWTVIEAWEHQHPDEIARLVADTVAQDRSKGLLDWIKRSRSKILL